MYGERTVGTEDAQTGTTSDVTHNARTGCTDDARTDAMSDVTHDVQTGCMDDAWTDATSDVMHDIQTGRMYDALTVGDFAVFSCRYFTMEFSPSLQGIFDGFAADSDELMDGLSE